MQEWKTGDTVRIIDRVPTHADSRSGLYYGHYRGLMGTIFKMYGSGETAQVAVDVNIETLPEEAAERHRDTHEKMRSGLPGEAKRSSAESDFRLRYVILVAASDLTRPALASSRNTR